MSITTIVCQDNSHKVLIYSLSNCIPCKEARQFLRDADIEFESIDIDLCNKKDPQMNELTKQPNIIIFKNFFLFFQ